MLLKRIVRWASKFRDMPNDSPTKTLLVALGVSFVCAVLISSAAVFLKPLQVANRELEREAQIQQIVTRLPGLEGLFGSIAAPQVESHVIEFSTGMTVPSIDPGQFDSRRAGSDPEQSIELPPEQDIAGIGRRAKFGSVSLVKNADKVELVILPVYGSGYASTLYGYLALSGDINTVVALTFFEHGETPGMGAEIDDPLWQERWEGIKVRDTEGRLRIGVAPGVVIPSSSEAAFQVDGITGATQTGRGVTNLLRFWLGDHGFGPYLQKIRSSGESSDG